jgi:phage terminase small subunit
MRRLTQKQDRFCWKYLELPSVTDAMIAAGYSPKYACQNSAHVLNSAVVQTRIQELKQKAEDDSVMNLLERKRRLSEIARAVIPDFVGDDGIKVTKDIPNVAAVEEITTRTKLYRKGSEPVVITNLKLHNPIPAIDLLNKMDKI